MAVAFDSTSGQQTSTSSPFTTSAWTIGSGTNNAALVAFQWIGGSSLGTATVTVGGVTCSLIANTNIVDGAQGIGIQLWGCTNVPPGSQTATLTWSAGSLTVVTGIIVATGVNQSTPFTQGQTTESVNPSLTFTDASGDLTSTAIFNTGSAPTTNQTLRWGSGTNEEGDTGPGSGNTTHTWTSASSVSLMSGVNIQQLSAVTTGDDGGLTIMTVTQW